MVNIPLFIKKGRNKNRQVGYYNTEDKTYYKTINYKSGQMLMNPKYSGLIGISKSIIAQLQGYGCKKIRIQIIGYEKNVFDIVITLNKFIEHSKEYDWDDIQLFSPLNLFERIYPEQEVLV